MISFRIDIAEDNLGHQRMVEITYDGIQIEYFISFLSHTYKKTKNDAIRIMIIHGIDSVSFNGKSMSIDSFLDLFLQDEEKTMVQLDLYVAMGVC